MAYTIAFFGTKPYDESSFTDKNKEFGFEIRYYKGHLNKNNVLLTQGVDAVCIFVNDIADAEVLRIMASNGVKLLALRCAGFNNIDLEKADECGMTVLRVPGYSPEAVAEHAMALALSVNRHIHKSYIRVRENNFSLVGLTGLNFHGKIAGIIGTGKIGAAMCRICHGFGMKVIAYDMYPNKDLDFVEYMPLEDVIKQSDLISLHCPLTEENHHMINAESLAKMKDGAVLINTAREELVDYVTAQALREGTLLGAGFDAIEEGIVKDAGLENAVLTQHLGGIPPTTL